MVVLTAVLPRFARAAADSSRLATSDGLGLAGAGAVGGGGRLGAGGRSELEAAEVGRLAGTEGEEAVAVAGAGVLAGRLVTLPRAELGG